MDPDMENQAVTDRYSSAPRRSDGNDKALEFHGESQNVITKIKKIFDVRQDEGTYLRMWNALFMLSCVLVSPDPLFCYVVNFKEDEKCLKMDERLKIVALVLRSLTDVIFFVHLICEILALKMSTSKNEQSEAVKQRLQSMLSIITDVLALIPFPQLAVLMFYGSEFVENTTLVNVFLLGQYVPRVIRIYLSGKVFKRMNGRWANCVFNLSLYIFAGHVLGAVWYLFSIQRAVSCWYKACAECIGNCEGILYCHNTTLSQPCSAIKSSAANVTEYLKEKCPLDTPDGASPPINYGIFLDSLKNENPKQEFGQKFVYAFWWGLRNLSNFGTNLVTSTYVLENFFAILISVIGLLLFIYLIGNAQVLMQTGATETLHRREQRKKKKKEAIKTLKEDIKTLKEAIKTLKKIPMLKDMDEEVLKTMCNYLKPATYVENIFVFRTGDPLDCMLLIIEGTMWTYTSSDSHAGQEISSMAIKPLEKGDFYGEELLDCASDFTKVPVSSKHVKCYTKVEAFVLMADDLFSPLKSHRDLLIRYNREELKKMTLSDFLRSNIKAQ